jgi:hypothetical protein
MLKKEANEIVGGLSKPGKMPCPSINLPAPACITGSILALIEGTTCYGCYALKGRYKFKTTIKAMARRLRALAHASWTTAMVTLMKNRKYFRWHDSGDLQGAQHLKNILEVCKQTPDTQHWLPTREAKLLQYLDPEVIPKNLLIRLSATKVDGAPSQAWPWTSTVVTNRGSRTCPAPSQGGKCIDCRQCWDRTIPNVAYAKH